MASGPLAPGARIEALATRVIGAAIQVHRVLGPRYVEAVYERALAIEFTQRGIPFREQAPLRLVYEGVEIGEHRLDFLVGGVLVVELKAVEELIPLHTAQVLSYLRTGGFRLGLLINFEVRLLRDGIARIILQVLNCQAAAS